MQCTHFVGVCVCSSGVIVRSYTLGVESVTLRWEETVGGVKVPSTSQTNMLRQSVNLRHLQKNHRRSHLPSGLAVGRDRGTVSCTCPVHTLTHSGERSHTASMCGWDQSVLVSDISLSWASALIFV